MFAIACKLPNNNDKAYIYIYIYIYIIIIIIIIIKIETTLQPGAELRGLHIITCTTYKYIINTIL